MTPLISLDGHPIEVGSVWYITDKAAKKYEWLSFRDPFIVTEIRDNGEIYTLRHTIRNSSVYRFHSTDLCHLNVEKAATDKLRKPIVSMLERKRELEEDLQDLLLYIKEKKKALALKNKINHHERLEQAIIRARRHFMVEDARLSLNDHLLITTKPITFHGIMLGRFLILILPFASNVAPIRVQNIDFWIPNHWSRNYHPFVDEDFTLHSCGVAPLISKFFEREQWYELIDLIITFLQEAQTDGVWEEEFKRLSAPVTEKSILLEP